jgi:hypothetical protein
LIETSFWQFHPVFNKGLEKHPILAQKVAHTLYERLFGDLRFCWEILTFFIDWRAELQSVGLGRFFLYFLALFFLTEF